MTVGKLTGFLYVSDVLADHQNKIVFLVLNKRTGKMHNFVDLWQHKTIVHAMAAGYGIAFSGFSVPTSLRMIAQFIHYRFEETEQVPTVWAQCKPEHVQSMYLKAVIKRYL